MMAHGVMIYHL